MLTLNLMGDPKLIMGSEHLHPPARLFQVIALLYFSPNYQLSRRKVGLLIWDTKDEKSALANLRQFLFRVSKYEPIARIIQFDHQNLFLDPATMRIDMSLLSESATTLDRLIEFWKGPFLDEDQPQSEAFQDWLVDKRQDIEDAYFRLAQGSLNLETFPGHATPQDVARVEQTLISIDPMRMQTYHSLAEAYGRLGEMSEIYRIRDMYRSKGHEDDNKLSQIIRRWATAKPITDDPILNFVPTLPTVAIIVQKGGFDHMRIAPFAMDLVASLARYRSFKTLAPSVKASGWLIGDQQTTGHEFEYALLLYQSPASLDQHAIGINLVQMSNRNIIWSGQFNLGQFGINDQVKRILEQITECVASRLISYRTAISHLTQDNTLYKAYLTAQSLIETADLASIRKARSILKSIQSADSGFSETTANIGLTLLNEWKLLGGTDPTLVENAYVCANQSIRNNPHTPLPFVVCARTSIHQRNFENALPALEEARAIFPNSPRLILEHADILSHLDLQDQAWDALQHAISLHSELTNQQLWTAASIALFSRRYHEARDFCQRITSDEIALGVRTASFALTGDMTGARFWASQLRQVLPDVSIDQLTRTTPFATKEAFEPYIEGLKMMGIT